MEQLIAAAVEHAKALRESADAADDYGACATEAQNRSVRCGRSQCQS